MNKPNRDAPAAMAPRSRCEIRVMARDVCQAIWRTDNPRDGEREAVIEGLAFNARNALIELLKEMR